MFNKACLDLFEIKDSAIINDKKKVSEIIHSKCQQLTLRKGKDLNKKSSLANLLQLRKS